MIPYCKRCKLDVTPERRCYHLHGCAIRATAWRDDAPAEINPADKVPAPTRVESER